MLRLLNGQVSDYLKLPIDARKKIRPPFDHNFIKNHSLIEALNLMQRKCCAYCETQFHYESNARLTHYRPLHNADNLQDIKAVENYCWFAYEWRNMLLLCGDCAEYKSNFFPIEGKVAPLKSEWQYANKVEQPNLLDPCIDNPIDHLMFDIEGNIFGITGRGNETISLLSLNRLQLIDERRLRFEIVIDVILHDTRERVSEVINETTSEGSPYSGAVLILLRSICQRLTGFGENRIARSRDRLIALVEHCKSQYDEEAWGKAIESVRYGRLNSPLEQVEWLHRKIDYSYIQTIEISNFKSIESFSLHLENGRSSMFAPSTILLGENGVGKSSVLQALDLALMPPKQRMRVMKGINQHTYNAYDSNFAENNEIELPIDITIKYENGKRTRLYQKIYKGAFHRDGEPLNVSISYGARRYFIEGKGSLNEVMPNITLFNPANFLQDPTLWLRNIDDEKFDAIARALRPILCMSGADHIFRDVNGFVFGSINGGVLPITKLSEGYRSLITMVVDMMRGLLADWDNLELARGVVIIDEIENHLHPRWKMRVMKALREAMPRVQFIVSTHDPLCLRGMNAGEVQVLYRNQDRHICSVEDLPDITTLRVDQILTSDYFGLSSSEDPQQMELLDKIAKYAAIPEGQLTDEERSGRDRALEEYGGIPYIGSSQDRHIVAEAITRHLHNEANLSVDQKISAREDSVQEILQVLQRAMHSYDIH
jgi:energy-coupling factor transporter ATP-binding protein EcfA2